MAKRKYKKRKKSAAAQHEVPGGFWQQVVGVLMIVVAVALVVTWFGSGGTLLAQIHHGAQSFFGLTAYILPFMLVYLAVQIFTSEENKISPAVFIATVLMIVILSGLTGVMFGDGGGGMLGGAMNRFMLQIMDSGIAVFLYIVLLFITVLFIIQVNPLTALQKSKSMVARPHKNMAEEVEDGGRKLKIRASEGAMAEMEKEKKLMFGFGKKKVAAPVKKAVAAPVKKAETALMSVSDPDWKMPPLDLLEKKQGQENPGNVKQNAYIIENTLSEFGINVEMDGANVGPRVTQYTMRPPSGVNLSKILARDKELALNLATDKVRIEAPIPGTKLVGVELPNMKSADVRLRGILESSEWKNASEALTFAVGKDISGHAVVANLGRMPHLLIAGTTGSGKSVMTNTLISSLLYRNAPSDLKLIIVDPKQVEMAQYEDIPHLLTPIITSTEKALSAMSWAVNEMERRYTEMAEKRVKKIEDYNAKVEAMKKEAPSGDEASGEANGEAAEEKAQEGRMPYIVIIIDEMADLMMMAGKDLEKLIVRIAQKGRAAGIHLVLATQRPEVKVITGLIKANIPGRIAFAVGSQMDSRIMLDMGGAEKLLGKGDMLMLTTEMMGKPRRIQGAFTSDDDIAKLTDFLRKQRPAQYNDEVVAQQVNIQGMGPAMGGAIGDMGRKYDPNDPLVRRAVEISLKNGKFSTASLQTWLGKGHGFVAGLAIWFEELGVIGPSNGNKPRDMLIHSMDEFDELVTGM
jgi:S-DNA-T family DNA segregation ATPase FtsK/SpoIIIE